MSGGSTAFFGWFNFGQNCVSIVQLSKNSIVFYQKIYTPFPQNIILVWIPLILSFNNLVSESPHPVGIPFTCHGVGMDIFNSCTFSPKQDSLAISNWVGTCVCGKTLSKVWSGVLGLKPKLWRKSVWQLCKHNPLSFHYTHYKMCRL